MIEFEGHDIVQSKVVSVNKVETFTTGSMFCSWDFGFKILLEGSSIEILVPTKTDGAGNHKLSQKERKVVAENKRDEFIKLYKDYKIVQ